MSRYKQIVILVLTLFLCSFSSRSIAGLAYYIYLNNNEEVHCELLSIDGSKALCRQIKTMLVYSYDSIQKIKVINEGKTFEFIDEIRNNKVKLAEAFEILNNKKLSHLTVQYNAKLEAEAEFERQRIEEELYSNQNKISSYGHSPNKRSLAQGSTGVNLKQQIELEKKRLRASMAAERSRTKEYLEHSKIIEKYNKKIAELEKDPQLYFYRLKIKSNNRSTSSSRTYHSDNSTNIGNCMGGCSSEQGICISQCMGNGQCIGNCGAAHGRCVSRCH